MGSDLIPNQMPKNDLDRLIEYLDGPYLNRRDKFRELLLASQNFVSKTSVSDLGFFIILFRSELDPWIALCGETLDRERGKQIGVSHNTESAKRRTAEVVKSEAAIFVAPLKRAQQELSSMQDLLSKTLSWCQSQQKTYSNDEFGDLFMGNNETPKEDFYDADTTSQSLKRISSS